MCYFCNSILAKWNDFMVEINGNALDSVGTNHGTVSGRVNYIQGKYGRQLRVFLQQIKFLLIQI